MLGAENPRAPSLWNLSDSHSHSNAFSLSFATSRGAETPSSLALQPHCWCHSRGAANSITVGHERLASIFIFLYFLLLLTLLFEVTNLNRFLSPHRPSQSHWTQYKQTEVSWRIVYVYVWMTVRMCKCLS